MGSHLPNISASTTLNGQQIKAKTETNPICRSYVMFLTVSEDVFKKNNKNHCLFDNGCTITASPLVVAWFGLFSFSVFWGLMTWKELIFLSFLNNSYICLPDLSQEMTEDPQLYHNYLTTHFSIYFLAKYRKLNIFCTTELGEKTSSFPKLSRITDMH